VLGQRAELSRTDPLSCLLDSDAALSFFLSPTDPVLSPLIAFRFFPPMAARSATSGGGGGGAAPAHVALSYPLVASVSPHFSLARVASEHVGIMRIRRLLFIAERCPPLSVEAFRLALQELKAAQPQRSFAPSSNPAQLSLPANLGPNPHLYAEVVTRAQVLLLQPSNQSEHAWFLSAGAAGRVAQDPLFAPDHAFFQSLQGNLDQAARGLEATLAQQKRDGEREGVKTALLNLAELYQNRGELNHALNKFMEGAIIFQHTCIIIYVRVKFN
jgi:hypothetical protein